MSLRPNSLLMPTKDVAATGPLLVDSNRISAVFHIQGAVSSTGKIRLESMAPSSHGEIWFQVIEVPLSGAKNYKGYCLKAPGIYRFTKTKTGKPVGIYTYTCGSA